MVGQQAYGERHRAGEAISTAFTECAVNQVISKGLVKRQQMRWSPKPKNSNDSPTGTPAVLQASSFGDEAPEERQAGAAFGMIVGNGIMVKAGDPVHLSPIPTTNAGQGFQGFFRPTA